MAVFKVPCTYPHLWHAGLPGGVAANLNYASGDDWGILGVLKMQISKSLPTYIPMVGAVGLYIKCPVMCNAFLLGISLATSFHNVKQKLMSRRSMSLWTANSVWTYPNIHNQNTRFAYNDKLFIPRTHYKFFIHPCQNTEWFERNIQDAMMLSLALI